jgi:hypothetical protein
MYILDNSIFSKWLEELGFATLLLLILMDLRMEKQAVMPCIPCLRVITPFGDQRSMEVLSIEMVVTRFPCIQMRYLQLRFQTMKWIFVRCATKLSKSVHDKIRVLILW